MRATDAKLNALDNSTKKADNSLLSMSNAGAAAAKGISLVATAGLAASAAITAATNAAIDYGKEIQIASNRSGETVENMQSLAFASNTVGISLEKLGDIGKDTNEKVGEFLATGGGGFKDFIDVMGLSTEEASKLANEFQNLSGPDVLQQMVSKMEEAGVSSEQMSFALEGMASDTTDLIPLLKNGGAEVKRLRAEFDGMGVTLNAIDLERIRKLGEETSKLASTAAGASSKAVSVLSEEITQITKLLASSSKDVGGLVVKAVTGYQVIVQEATAALMNMFREAEILSLEAKSAIVGIFGDNTEIEAELAKLKESDALRDAFDAEFLAEKWDAAQNKVKEYYGELKTQQESIVESDDTANTLPNSSKSNPEEDKRKEKILEGLKDERQILEEKYLSDQELFKDNKEVLLQLEEQYQERLAELNQNNSLDAIAERFKSEEELLQEKLERELEIVGENEELRMELKEQFIDDALALDQKYEDERLKIEEKAAKKKKKEEESAKKIEDKVAADKAKMDETNAYRAMALSSMVFEDSKEVSAGIAFINTAEGVTAALAKYDYVGAALIAAMGAAQISSILSATKGGGGSTASVSQPTEQQTNQDDDFSSLELTESGDSGTGTIRVEFATDSGDALLDILAGGLNERQRQGR